MCAHPHGSAPPCPPSHVAFVVVGSVPYSERNALGRFTCVVREARLGRPVGDSLSDLSSAVSVVVSVRHGSVMIRFWLHAAQPGPCEFHSCGNRAKG